MKEIQHNAECYSWYYWTDTIDGDVKFFLC